MSTIKVDTYLTRGGASEIAIDKLKGASSAASISVVGEGGTNTTDLQQGLAKVFANVKQSDQTFNESFNCSSLADVATGRSQINFTNNMGNQEFCPAGIVPPASFTSYVSVLQWETTSSTSSARIMRSYWNADFGEVADAARCGFIVHGDLA